jgi:DNA-binding NtrC family response regulator
MLISVAPGRYEFKKGGSKVRKFALPGKLSGRAHMVEIEKIGNWYGICVDNKRIGAWHDTRPLHGESDNLIYMFLLPNQKMLIKNIELHSRPARRPDNGDAGEALTALFPDHLPGRVFSVHIDQYAVHGENYTAFEFDDITALERNIVSLRSERNKLAALLGQENEFVGRSISITNIHQDMRRIAASSLSVLVEGETGTGKEVLARAIHGYSPRADGPFVKIDCAAIPRELLESELFGHERGAFTGASSAHAGKFEQAMGGTVFLDEISNIPVATQAKLLNVLQDLRVQRLGSQKPLTLDVRIVAATNRPLSALIKEKLFREDLYYRINQFRFALPPLRERGEDIPLLAVHFIKLANQTYKKKVKGLSTEAARVLLGHAWPGNVRELRNVIFRAVVFCDSEEIGPADISIEAGEAAAPGPARRGGKTSVISRERLEAVLDDVEGNVARASRKLGISRVSLYALLKRHGLKAGDFKISKS